MRSIGCSAMTTNAGEQQDHSCGVGHSFQPMFNTPSSAHVETLVGCIWFQSTWNKACSDKHRICHLVPCTSTGPQVAFVHSCTLSSTSIDTHGLTNHLQPRGLNWSPSSRRRASLLVTKNARTVQCTKFHSLHQCSCTRSCTVAPAIPKTSMRCFSGATKWTWQHWQCWHLGKAKVNLWL